MYYGNDGVLLGSAKASEARKRARDEREAENDAARSERVLELKRQTLEAQISALRAEFAAHEDEAKRRLRSVREGNDALRLDRERMARLRTDAGNRSNGEGERA